MRRFVFVSHEMDGQGDMSLDNLPGTGRVDVMCRNIQAALHLSHGLRPDVEVYVVVAKADRTVRFAGNRINKLNPDERSTAARLQQALKDSGAGPSWKDVQAGLAVAGLGLEDLLDELPGTPILLDPKGTAIADVAWPEDPVCILSDHIPFTPDEEAMLRNHCQLQISLGEPWYHGNHVVAVVQHALDMAVGTPAVR